MTRHYTRKSPSKLLTSLTFALFAGAACNYAFGADMTAAEAQQRYKEDVDRCNRGDTAQDKATCLREAGAALEEARRNRLLRASPSYENNQRARCDHLSGTARDDCMQLMSDPSPQIQGSVEGGGVLRQTTITVPGDTAAPGGYPPASGTQGVNPSAPAAGSSGMAPATTPSTGTGGTMGSGTAPDTTSSYGGSPATGAGTGTMPSYDNAPATGGSSYGNAPATGGSSYGSSTVPQTGVAPR